MARKQIFSVAFDSDVKEAIRGARNYFKLKSDGELIRRAVLFYLEHLHNNIQGLEHGQITSSEANTEAK